MSTYGCIMQVLSNNCLICGSDVEEHHLAEGIHCISELAKRVDEKDSTTYFQNGQCAGCETNLNEHDEYEMHTCLTGLTEYLNGDFD